MVLLDFEYMICFYSFEVDWWGEDSKYEKSNRKAMNRNWSNQKANPALKTKTYLYAYKTNKGSDQPLQLCSLSSPLLLTIFVGKCCSVDLVLKRPKWTILKVEE